MSRRYSPARLALACKAAGKTRDQLADDLGRSVHTIARYEQGEAIPPMHVLRAIAEALGVPVTDLHDPADPTDPVTRYAAEVKAVAAGFGPLTEPQRAQVRTLLPRVTHLANARQAGAQRVPGGGSP